LGTCFQTCASSAKEKQDLYNLATSSSILEANLGSHSFSLDYTCDELPFTVAIGTIGVLANYSNVYSGVDPKNYETLRWNLPSSYVPESA
jgi:hypothetical protein